MLVEGLIEQQLLIKPQLDDITITITSIPLKTALYLTAADRRWVDFIYQKVASTWDPANPSRPTNYGYIGSEDFIRFQFEEYLLALISATKYHLYLHNVLSSRRELTAFAEFEGDPSVDFGEMWLEMWKKTANHQLWQRNTDSHLFDIVDPRHPTAGSLSLDDINRRVAKQIEERFNNGKEVLSRHLTTGKKHVSEALSKAWADFDAYRAMQQNEIPSSIGRNQETDDSIPSPPATAPLPSINSSKLSSPSYFGYPSQSSTATQTPTSATAFLDTSSIRARAPDMSSAHAAVGAAGQRATAYFSSWGSWASEKRKGWSSSTAGTPITTNCSDTSSTSNQNEKRDTRNPRKLMMVERMRHADSKTEDKSSWSAPPRATTYNPFSRLVSHDTSVPLSPPPIPKESGNIQTSPSATSTTLVNHNIKEQNPSTTVHQEQSTSPQPITEPRSPGTKRGIGKGKRREEKGSDGIGRLDA